MTAAGTAIGRTALDVTVKEIDEWFVENLRIRAEDGQIIPFTMKPIQFALTEHVVDCFRNGRPCYIIVLKARQEGVSTWAEALLFWMARNLPNSRVLVTAHDDDSTQNIFDMTYRYYENLPEEVPTERSSAKTLRFEDTDSEFVIKTAGAKGRVGRSFTLTGVHISELDFFPDALKTLQSLMQSVPKVGGTIRIIESTADGPMGAMQLMWDRSVEGRSEFKPFFFPWHADAKYTRPISWSDLEKYGPKGWVNKHRAMIEKGRRDAALSKERYDGVGTGESGGGRSDSSDKNIGGSGTGGVETESGLTDSGGGGKGAKARGGKEKSEAGSASDRRWGARSVHRKRREDGERDPDDSRRDPDTGRIGKGRRIIGSSPWGTARIGDPKGENPKYTDLQGAFESSLTEYEEGLLIEFDLSLDQINWRRFCLENDCSGDETTMRREYPSRPEEAFEASGGDILDQRVLARWAKEAKARGPKAIVRMAARERPDGEVVVSVEEDDRGGRVEIYEWPNHVNGEEDRKSRHSYVMGVDTSLGTESGDWQVACVLDIETGEQVAEFRAKMDTDIAVDQIEWLGLFYNNAYTGIETSGGYGIPFIRHIHDRGLLNLYERESFDRYSRTYMKKPGWDTNTKTRPLIVSETKTMVREELCRLWSLETITECRLLHENDQGKIEARATFHDDGWIAYGIAGILRNKKLGYEPGKAEREAKSTVNEFLKDLNRRQAQIDRYKEDRFSRITYRDVAKPKSQMALRRSRVDGRRSWM